MFHSIAMKLMGDFKSLVDGCNSNPTALPASDITPLEDSTLKVGRLSPEERKEKIHRYLKKRTERNFNKKIKVRWTSSFVIVQKSNIFNPDIYLISEY